MINLILLSYQQHVTNISAGYFANLNKVYRDIFQVVNNIWRVNISCICFPNLHAKALLSERCTWRSVRFIDYNISHKCQTMFSIFPRFWSRSLSSIFAKCLEGDSLMANFSLILCVQVHTIAGAMVEIPITVSVQIPVPLIAPRALPLSYLAARPRLVSAIYTSHELMLIVIRNSDGVLFRFGLLCSFFARQAEQPLISSMMINTTIMWFIADNSEWPLVVASCQD